MVCHNLLLGYFSIFSLICESLLNSHLAFSQVWLYLSSKPDKVNEVLLPRCPGVNHCSWIIKSQNHLRKVPVAGIQGRIILSVCFNISLSYLLLPESRNRWLYSPTLPGHCISTLLFNIGFLMPFKAGGLLKFLLTNDSSKSDWPEHLACHPPFPAAAPTLCSIFNLGCQVPMFLANTCHFLLSWSRNGLLNHPCPMFLAHFSHLSRDSLLQSIFTFPNVHPFDFCSPYFAMPCPQYC